MARHLNRLLCQPKSAARKALRSRAVVDGLPQMKMLIPYWERSSCSVGTGVRTGAVTMPIASANAGADGVNNSAAAASRPETRAKRFTTRHYTDPSTAWDYAAITSWSRLCDDARQRRYWIQHVI